MKVLEVVDGTVAIEFSGPLALAQSIASSIGESSRSIESSHQAGVTPGGKGRERGGESDHRSADVDSAAGRFINTHRSYPRTKNPFPIHRRPP